jgi:molybdopterin synthase sulfur carrier subunit
MHLELRFFATFRAIVGQKYLEREFPDGSTVGEVLAILEGDYPDMDDQLLDEHGEIREQLSILKNGRGVVHMEGAATPMADGDTLSVFPPVAGGTDEQATDSVAVEDPSDDRIRRERSFRGISKRLAVHYLENLGGELVAGDPEDDAEARVAGEGWQATASAGQVEIAGGTMRLTQVDLVFEGEPDVLEPLIEQFAQKAMRAGG